MQNIWILFWPHIPNVSSPIVGIVEILDVFALLIYTYTLLRLCLSSDDTDLAYMYIIVSTCMRTEFTSATPPLKGNR